MRRGRIRNLLVVLSVLVIAAACSPAEEGESSLQPGAGDPSAPQAADAGPSEGGADSEAIRFAASLPLTGEFSIPGAKHRDG